MASSQCLDGVDISFFPILVDCIGIHHATPRQTDAVVVEMIIVWIVAVEYSITTFSQGRFGHVLLIVTFECCITPFSHGRLDVIFT